MEPKYKPGTSQADIIFDGWARGLDVAQIASELEASGFTVTEKDVQRECSTHQDNMEAFFQRND